MKIIDLKNMPLHDNNTGSRRSKRCNLITFYCARCNMVHTLERNEVWCFDFEDEQIMCCYESVQDMIDELI